MTRNGKQRYFTVIFGADGNPRIPPFNNVQVSTMTVIAYTNLVVNTDKFYQYMPITDWTIVKKKRGEKRRFSQKTPTRTSRRDR